MKYIALILKILITIPVLAFLFFVTLSNRDQSLSVIWSPLHDSVHLSLPIIFFAALVIGFVWGSLILWSNTLELRAERRNYKKQITVLENQLQILRDERERAKPVIITSTEPTPRIAAVNVSPDIL